MGKGGNSAREENEYFLREFDTLENVCSRLDVGAIFSRQCLWKQPRLHGQRASGSLLCVEWTRFWVDAQFSSSQQHKSGAGFVSVFGLTSCLLLLYLGNPFTFLKSPLVSNKREIVAYFPVCILTTCFWSKTSDASSYPSIKWTSFFFFPLGVRCWVGWFKRFFLFCYPQGKMWQKHVWLQAAGFDWPPCCLGNQGLEDRCWANE